MKVIQPNCRLQFTAEDIEFVVRTLNRRRQDSAFLAELLADEEMRDQILDDEQLYQTLIEHRGCLRVSDHFYFYVIVRRVLREAGIEDRSVADYVAEMLCEFSRQDRTRCALPGRAEPLDYFFEMLAALRTVDERTNFYLRAHMGNHSLFLAGVFPERIRLRAESRGFPDLDYYEAVGQSSYRAAGDHRLAERYELGPIFCTLSDSFHQARLALNDAAQRLFSIDGSEAALDHLLLKFSPNDSN